MNFKRLRTERDRIDQLVNMGQFGPSPASKVFLEAVNNANRTLGQFSNGEADETAVNQSLTEVEALVSQAPEGMPRTSLQKYLIAARDAMANPNAVEAGDSGGGIIGVIPETTDMTGGAGVVADTTGISRNPQSITGEAPAVSPDELAFLQTLRDKGKREAECDQTIKQDLDKLNCSLQAFFVVGGQLVPSSQMVTLPMVIKSVAK